MHGVCDLFHFVCVIGVYIVSAFGSDVGVPFCRRVARHALPRGQSSPSHSPVRGPARLPDGKLELCQGVLLALPTALWSNVSTSLVASSQSDRVVVHFSMAE